MAASLNSLLTEADSIIESRLSSKAPAVQDDIFKLAEELKASSVKNDDLDLTLTEKIAHSIAIVDTLLNLEALTKMASFEEKAKESGFSEEQISEFFEKKASIKFRSVLEDLDWMRPQ